MTKAGKLILEDGTEMTGKIFGYSGNIAGEVVFNTAMTGYPESLTDPSYRGQILVATFPLIGNYGVPNKDSENTLLTHYESDKIQVSGLIISNYSQEYSHWNAERSLEEWMIENKIPGLYDIDTRTLTKIIREKGVLLGKIIVNEEHLDFHDPNENNLVAEVSIPQPQIYGNGKYRILLVDCGVKNNIIRHLLKRNTTIIRVPWNYDFSKEDYDGLFISNGPGDPKTCVPTIQNLKSAFHKEEPIFGICLGNQLMALASGADTFKLKYGHRSHNQPIIQAGTNKAYITSQNHGYAVDSESLSSEWKTLFINLNDGTNEGFQHKRKPFFSTQFHPEASSGPTDTEYLFDQFLDMVIQYVDSKKPR